MPAAVGHYASATVIGAEEVGVHVRGKVLLALDGQPQAPLGTMYHLYFLVFLDLDSLISADE